MKHCILIVDDEPNVRLNYRVAIETEGFEVREAPDGGAALRELAGKEFDLAILDVNLNGQVVYPLAEELLSRAKPFVLLTGYGAESLPHHFRSLPRLSKPYDLTNLVKEIGRALPAAG